MSGVWGVIFQGMPCTQRQVFLKKGSFMCRKSIILTFLTMIITFVIVPMAFAEEQKIHISHVCKSPNENLNLLEKDPATWDKVMDGAWGQIMTTPEDPKDRSPFNGHNLLPWHSESCPDFSLISIESAVTDEFQDAHVEGDIEPGIIVGLKYTFKRFQLHCLHRSIISFFSNTPKNERHSGQSLALYFEVP